MILLAFLLALATLFLIVAGWYLIFRKPPSQIFPPIGVETMPNWSYNIYGVKRPMGVAVSPSGDRLYVTDSGGDRLLHVYDGKGTEIAKSAPPSTTPSARVPVYVAIDPLTGNVYVSDRIAQAIEVYDRDGKYLKNFVPNPAIPGWQPLGLAFDPSGNLYVGDLGGAAFHRILEFDRDGVLKRTIGTKGEFNFPNGLAADAKGNLFVADGNNGRVVVIDPSGKEIGVIPRGVGQGALGLPRGVSLDDQGRLVVVDAVGQAVQFYRLDASTDLPSYAGTAGAEGTGDGLFEYPVGVATDTRSRVYVADWANDRVQVWSY